MAEFVLDASVAISWCFPGDPTEDTPYSRKVLRELITLDAVVPEIWAFEIANNIFVSHSKRKRIDERQVVGRNIGIVLPVVQPKWDGEIVRSNGRLRIDERVARVHSRHEKRGTDKTVLSDISAEFRGHDYICDLRRHSKSSIQFGVWIESTACRLVSHRVRLDR